MATWADVRKFAMKMPEAVEEVRRESFVWLVGDRFFAWQRPLGKKDRKDLGPAAPDGPILAVRIADLEFRDVLIASDPDVFFTIPHFDGYEAVLIRLDKIAPAGLERVIVDAWLARAPEKLAAAYLASRRAKPSRKRS